MSYGPAHPNSKSLLIGIPEEVFFSRLIANPIFKNPNLTLAMLIL